MEGWTFHTSELRGVGVEVGDFLFAIRKPMMMTVVATLDACPCVMRYIHQDL